MQVAAEADAQGWRLVTLPIVSIREGAMEFLRFGMEIEVLEPPELRARMIEITAGLSRLYRAAPAPPA